MDSPDVLEGPRVRLVVPRVEHADAFFERVTSDPEVAHYLSWATHPDVDETRRVITEVFNVVTETGTEHARLIELRDSGDIAGVCGWRWLSEHTVEIGYCLARPLWGRHLMAEVVTLLMDMLAGDPTVYRVSATCHVDNARSARVLERAGLSLEGRLVRHTVFPNIGPEPRDVLLFAKAMR